mgnify:CR=1 FL=1
MAEEPTAKRPRPDFCRSGSRPDVLPFVPSAFFLGIVPTEPGGKGDCASWFHAHDTDGDGRLTEKEYRNLLLSVGTEVDKLHSKYVDHILAQTKRDADGTVTLQAFSEMYDRLHDMDRMLRAPRRKRDTQSSATNLILSSRVAQRSSILLPEVPCVAHTVGYGHRRTTFVLPERYSNLNMIGEGAYGVLVRATDALAPPGVSRMVAIKRIKPTSDALQLRCCLRELAILRHIAANPHPNLLGLRCVVPPPGGKIADWHDLYLVTELYDADLRAIIKSSQPLSEEHVQFFTWQLLRGLYALHSMGVVHRDIKPSNLLVNANCDLRIADFGIARGLGRTGVAAAAAATRRAEAFANTILGRSMFGWNNYCVREAANNPEGASSGETDSLAPPGDGKCARIEGCDEDTGLFTSYAVTRWYRPPELLCGNKRYGPSIDVWSAGCVLAELLGRAPLFPEKDHMDMLRVIVKQLGSPSPTALSRILDPRAVRFLQRLPAAEKRPWSTRLPGCTILPLDLLDRLLRFDPDERILLDDAMRHTWLLPLITRDDTRPLPICKFDFEGMPPNLDHFFLAALDAAAETNKDVGYSFRLPEMLRFGILHDRTVYPLDEGPAKDSASDDEKLDLFPSGSPDNGGTEPSPTPNQ